MHKEQYSATLVDLSQQIGKPMSVTITQLQTDLHQAADILRDSAQEALDEGMARFAEMSLDVASMISHVLPGVSEETREADERILAEATRLIESFRRFQSRIPK